VDEEALAHWGGGGLLRTPPPHKKGFIKTTSYKYPKICIIINYSVYKLSCPLILHEFPEHENFFPHRRGLQAVEISQLV